VDLEGREGGRNICLESEALLAFGDYERKSKASILAKMFYFMLEDTLEVMRWAEERDLGLEFGQAVEQHGHSRTWRTKCSKIHEF